MSVKYIKKELDQNKVLIDDIQAGTKALSKDLRYVNNTMKSVLTKMREPNKLCLDITFMVILCTMLGVFFYVGTKYYNALKLDGVSTEAPVAPPA